MCLSTNQVTHTTVTSAECSDPQPFPGISAVWEVWRLWNGWMAAVWPMGLRKMVTGPTYYREEVHLHTIGIGWSCYAIYLAAGFTDTLAGMLSHESEPDSNDGNLWVAYHHRSSRRRYVISTIGNKGVFAFWHLITQLPAAIWKGMFRRGWQDTWRMVIKIFQFVHLWRGYHWNYAKGQSDSGGREALPMEVMEGVLEYVCLLYIVQVLPWFWEVQLRFPKWEWVPDSGDRNFHWMHPTSLQEEGRQSSLNGLSRSWLGNPKSFRRYGYYQLAPLLERQQGGEKWGWNSHNQ